MEIDEDMEILNPTSKLMAKFNNSNINIFKVRIDNLSMYKYIVTLHFLVKKRVNLPKIVNFLQIIYCKFFSDNAALNLILPPAKCSNRKLMITFATLKLKLLL